MDKQKQQQYIGIVVKKIQLTNTIFHFVIQNEYPIDLHFQSGQYAAFIIDPQTRRQYSFCSDPHSTNQFEIVIDVSPMGPGSKYFLGKNVGDRVEFLAPLGNFVLSENSYKKILVATGTGIAPYRSMLLEKVHSSLFMVHGKDNNSLVSMNYELQTTNFSLYWGLRYEDDVYWDRELKDLVGQLTGSEVFLCLSKPSEDWENSPPPSPRFRRAKGHVTQQVLKNEKNLANCEFYLCGNTAMITEMEKLLSAQNVKNERIKKDLFY